MASFLKVTSLLHVFCIVMFNYFALTYSLQELGGRVKRQDGYVYDKPNISFNLPTRPPSTVSTQAPTFNRPQEQQMYYAYPAPAGGDTVNIGYSTAGPSSTTSSTSSVVTSTASSEGSGYNYGTQSTASAESGVSSSGTNSGYNYNSPTTTAVTTAGTVSQTVPSTNAPKYLPPTSGGGGGAGGGVSVNIPTGGVSTVPSVTNAGVSVPNTDYLPPRPNQPSPGPPSSTPSPAPTPGPSPSPLPSSTPTVGYLPPSGSPTTSVPAPAATYLPPVL